MTARLALGRDWYEARRRRRQRPAPVGRPIRILWLIATMGPGGAERLLISFAGRHDRTMFDLETVFLHEEINLLVPELEAAGVVVHRLGIKSAIDPRWTWRIRRIIERGHYDIVHVHSPLAAGIIPVVLQTVPASRRPRLVLTEHNSWGSYRRPVRILNALAFVADDARIAVSSEARSSLPAPMRHRTQVVVAGVPAAELEPMRRDREAIRSEFGVAEGDFLAVSVANFRPEKDHPVLLAAARQVLEQRSNVQFLLVGVGPLEEEVRQLHAKLGLGDRFRILGYQPSAVRIVAGADVFVLSSIFEGFPIAVMEALAVGVPVVATAVGGVPDAVRDGIEGRVVPPQRPDLLAAAILDLAGDPVRRQAMATAAFERGAKYDISIAVKKIEAIYRAVAAGESVRGLRRRPAPFTADGEP